MARVLVIGTGHNTLGQCNVDALALLLEKIAPDVIFEEIRPTEFDTRYADPMMHSLEMRAVSRYVQDKVVPQVPVDEYDVPPDFRRNADRLFQHVETQSSDYRALLAVEHAEISRYGFAYLNSSEWAALEHDKRAVMTASIAASGDTELQQSLSTWFALVRQREVAMVSNIYAYAKTSPFTQGVFLVGAAHRAGLAEIVADSSDADRHSMEWDFVRG